MILAYGECIMTQPEPCGWLVVDKPAGMTSHDVIARLRRTTRYRRFGHSGTLDPDATGVLVLAVGSATRLIQYLPTGKSYRAVIRLGITTDSQDASGQVLATRPVTLTPAEIGGALQQFTGKISQLPPMVSAVHYQGKRLYELARAGQDVPDRPHREVTIERIDLLAVELPLVTIAVACSGGTYIRTLAHDLGERLGCGAHLAVLRRLTANGLDIARARPLEELMQIGERALDDVVAPHLPLAHLPVLRLAEHDLLRLQQGQKLAGIAGAAAPGFYCVFDDADEQLKAIAESQDGVLIPRTVLAGKGGA